MKETRDLDLTPVEPIIEKYRPGGRTMLLPALFDLQEQYGFLPKAAVEVLGRGLRIPLAEIHGVIEFYTMFYPHPTAETFVRVCTSTPCVQLGGEEALEAAGAYLGVNPDGADEASRYYLEESPCLGLCDHAPAALVGEVPVGRIDPSRPEGWIRKPSEVPLGQVEGDPRWLTGRVGVIKPTDLQGYQARDGYRGLRKALEGMDPTDVVQVIKDSGLMGRGGAAFPTGLKWEYTAGAPGETRYVVCNADESEPGTFKDRVLMEGDPFSVLEGMTLAGYAIGSEKGFIYIRGEYPRARKLLQEAIKKAHAGGFLGEDILGRGYHFDIEIRSGAGAYICGEETALFESIEGRRGFPRLKPPFPTTHGLYGKPTVINNVETLAAAAWIVANGADAYRSVGTADSPGSKLFCLSGDVSTPGAYEVPFGTPLRELIDLAGGAVGEVQAVLLGGAAGTFAGPGQLDVPMSFEGLQEQGLPLGSGVVMVVNKERDMGDILLSLAHFFSHESCGKCFPCQLGTQRQVELVAKAMQGNAKPEDLASLRDVQFTMTNASICGLGMTAGMAIESAMDKWPELFNGAG